MGTTGSSATVGTICWRAARATTCTSGTPGTENDTIRDAAGLNRVKFGADVVPDDIWVAKDAEGKFLYDHRTKESIRLDGAELHEVLFSDGTVWTRQDMQERLQDVLFGTDGDDTLKNPEASGESKSGVFNF